MIAKKSDFRRFLDKVSKGRGKELSDLLNDPLVLKIRKNLLSPETWGSEDFLISYSGTTWFLGLDPPGTGKTFLAMIAALHSLLEGKVQRIVLARPAVEAGEALGFCPETSRRNFFLIFDPYMMLWTKCLVQLRQGNW